MHLLTSMRLASIVAAAAVALTCARPPVPEPAPPSLPGPVPASATACELLSQPREDPGEITVALLDEVDVGHAPWPQNDGERLLFRHLYETLLRVDCQDSVHPGLAESWSSAGDGRLWRFTLREGASFWDGVPVTADHVVASWAGGAAEELASAAGIDSLKVESARRLAVYLDRARPEVPRLFADPEFAVARRVEPWYWPYGSAPGHVEMGEVGGEDRVDHREVRLHPPDAEGPVVRFLQFPGVDPRDVLRGGYDVLVTGDQSVIEYAAPQPTHSSVPLPWDRSYVLLSTTRVRELRMGGEPGGLSNDLLDALARDAVRSDARGHRPPSWWEDTATCGELSPASSGLPRIAPGAYRTSGPRRIVYPLGDHVARGLSQRIVGLAAERARRSEEAGALAAAVPGLVGEDGTLLAAGLAGDELDASLRYGDEFAYVVPLPRIVVDPCFAARKLASRVEWLAPQELDLASTLVPLVDTRRHVVAASGRVGLYVDWDGTVLISAAPAGGGSRQ
ncbi:MAG: hypothetical protein JSV86_01075 [Gemmatimonadota bacterium]|nr:MAG: hypothetical protein JSV86_01075 [Gemmatimonadota bacterium]